MKHFQILISVKTHYQSFFLLWAWYQHTPQNITWLLLWSSELICSIRTCSEEQHLVVAVGSHDLVHGNWCVFVVGVGSNHQRSPAHRVDWVEHYWVVPHKGHHIIGELLCCMDVGCEGSTGTLEKQRKWSVCYKERNSYNLKKESHQWQTKHIHLFMWASFNMIVLKIKDNNI